MKIGYPKIKKKDVFDNFKIKKEIKMTIINNSNLPNNIIFIFIFMNICY